MSTKEIAAALQKAFEHIQFVREPHSYWIGDVRMRGTTRLLSEFQKPFNTEFWSTYKAFEASGYVPKYQGNDKEFKVKRSVITVDSDLAEWKLSVSPEDIKKEWADKAKAGRDRGTHIHAYLENGWKGEPSSGENIPLLDVFLERKKEEISPVALECVVGDESVNIVGLFDGLFIALDNGRLQLRDTKTDKEIVFNSKYDYMQFPFEHLEDCSFNKYCLQLNIYARILRNVANIEVDELIIDHFDKDLTHNEYGVPFFNDEMDNLWQLLEKK